MSLYREVFFAGLVVVAAMAGPQVAATYADAAPIGQPGVDSLVKPVVATAGKAAPSVYTVLDGDSLWATSLKMKVAFPALLASNNLSATSVIVPGQQLVAPAGAVAPSTTTRSATTVAAPRTASSSTSSRNRSPHGSAPAPSASAPVSAAATAATSYTVVVGDYLYGIAHHFSVPFGALLAANNFTPTSAIFPGTTIVIPAGASTTPKTAAVKVSTATAASAAASPPAAAAATAVAPASPVAVNLASTGNAKLDAVLAFAVAQIGKPYVFAAAGPDSYDCSGLVLAAYAQAGIPLIHQSAIQAGEGTAVDWNKSPILPGDLLFMIGSDTPGVLSHVGMAISSTQWIQASRPGTPVAIGPMPTSQRISAVRRFISV